jgi:hypothetical protein
MYLRAVIGAPLVVIRERDRLRHLIGRRVYARRNTEIGQRARDPAIEVGDRHRLQREGQGPDIRAEAQGVVHEVELQGEGARAVRDHTGGQPARRDIERRLPGMIQPRRLGEPHLADDLGPEVQRRIGLAPFSVRQRRPGVSLGRCRHVASSDGSLRCGPGKHHRTLGDMLWNDKAWGRPPMGCSHWARVDADR